MGIPSRSKATDLKLFLGNVANSIAEITLLLLKIIGDSYMSLNILRKFRVKIAIGRLFADLLMI